MASITARDGEIYTDPSQIKIPRNENTEIFYCLLEDYMEMQEKQRLTAKVDAADKRDI